MEGITQKVRRQILADFYQNNLAKGKQHTFDHFIKMGYKKSTIYRIMQRVDAGESMEQREGQGQAQVIQLFHSIKSNIVITAREGPYATFH